MSSGGFFEGGRDFLVFYKRVSEKFVSEVKKELTFSLIH